MTAPKTPTQQHTPLPPEQQQKLLALVEERQARLLEQVTVMIQEAVAPLEAKLTEQAAQVAEAIKWGDAIALRAAQGQVLCADEGGPSTSNVPITFSSRQNVAAHESFKTERGQG